MFWTTPTTVPCRYFRLSGLPSATSYIALVDIAISAVGSVAIEGVEGHQGHRQCLGTGRQGDLGCQRQIRPLRLPHLLHPTYDISNCCVAVRYAAASGDTVGYVRSTSVWVRSPDALRVPALHPSVAGVGRPASKHACRVIEMLLTGA